ncbi:PilZ domain-containing protein [Parafrankia sp. BMG5.11]|uniref:PilZ domain-containing protein n=1 Tax=Parafrankia sp. BMG5.11 TaxID=222540 RepID=UPI00103B15AB|nr:PilZ domain-containing protein [Parafrankia sp. BMG5.11]TCJ40890.1 PilZ domain-containing protein [Parafrankia sp. BMG5.11]
MERRASPRRTVNLSVVCRVPASPHSARILDVSQSGCRLALSQGHVLLGSTVHVTLTNALQISGTVTWSHGAEVGVRFHRRLSDRQAIDLGIMDGPPTPEEKTDTVYIAPGGGLHHWVRRVMGWKSTHAGPPGDQPPTAQ